MRVPFTPPPRRLRALGSWAWVREARPTWGLFDCGVLHQSTCAAAFSAIWLFVPKAYLWRWRLITCGCALRFICAVHFRAAVSSPLTHCSCTLRLLHGEAKLHPAWQFVNSA